MTPAIFPHCRPSPPDAEGYRQYPFIAVLYRSFPHRARSLPVLYRRNPPTSGHFRIAHARPLFTAEIHRMPLMSAHFRTASARPLFSARKWPFWATIEPRPDRPIWARLRVCIGYVVYRRLWLISACAYSSKWKGNMRLIKNMCLYM